MKKPTRYLALKALGIRLGKVLARAHRRKESPRTVRRRAPHGYLYRAVSLGLVTALLSSSTPAASLVLQPMFMEARTGLFFWFNASGWSNTLLGLFSAQRPPAGAKRQETQSERDARVSRITIKPGDVTIRVGERVMFSAVASDGNGVPVSGVGFKWAAVDLGRQLPARLKPNGQFVATASGNYKITAEGAGKKAQVMVRVEPAQGRKPDEKPSQVREVSTRDLPATSAARSRKEAKAVARARTGDDGAVVFTNASYHPAAATAKRASLAATAAYLPPADSPLWDDSNYWSADDPGNQVGNPPGTPADGGAGSGNFQLTAPVISLAGRGLSLSLSLTYNSRLWHKAGSQITYDIDHDWPAPGWSLGFGKMVSMGGNNGTMLIDADGTRHSYSGSLQVYTYSTYFNAHTTDGTFIDYYSQTYGTNRALQYGWVKYPNGTVVEYGAPGQNALYPTSITDANGNYIAITYVNNQGPRINTITDTMGRVVNFYYDYNNLLTAITGPGISGGTRTLVRLHYRQLTLNYAFYYTLTPVVSNPYPWVIDAIYYPSNGNGYWFGDSDSYSSYGMLARATGQRSMGFSAASLDDQGTVWPGALTQQHEYNYPLQPDSSLTDAPTYSTMTERWSRDGINIDQAVTSYSIQQNASPRTTVITLPNGAKSIQYALNAPGQFNDGLVYRDETRDAANSLLQSSEVQWEPGAYDSPRASRSTITDERGQVTAVEFSYGPYNQVTEVRDFDYGGASLLRITRAQYENSANYTNRHIFSLPTVVEVFAPDGATRLSRTEYQYDGGTLADAPGVTMHQETHNPYAPWYDQPCDCWYEYNEWGYEEYVCHSTCQYTDYDPSTNYRGNTTQVKTYADAASLNEATAAVETRSYDMTGNMIAGSTSCCDQVTFGYDLSTQYAYPLTKTRGSATDPAAQLHTSASYDFNTGLTLSTTDANNRTTQFSFFTDSLRPQNTYYPTSAYTAFSYDDAGMTVTESSYLAGGALAEQNVKTFNGRSQVWQEKALGAGGVWDIVSTQYDAFGRITQMTRPYRNGETPQWTSFTYDALGRVTTLQAPDGSTTQVVYNSPSRPGVASGTPGQTVKYVDAWGRERWLRYDAPGHLVEVVEPNPSGDGSVTSGGYVTTYGYDLLGNLTSVNQNGQTRAFRYDSLGRMTHQRLAEMNATLNDAGAYVGAGQWSDVFTYDNRSNLTSHKDARGVKVNFNYNNDPLSRVQSVTYDTSGFGDTANPILPAADISYTYATSGDVTRVSSVRVAGVSTESNSYDVEGREIQKTVTLDSRPSHPMVTDYIYDSLGRITDVRYPAQYGVAGSPRKLVHHDYDVAGHITSLKVDGTNYASQAVYNADSQLTSMSVGASGQLAESYSYNPQTGLMENQTVTRGGATLLNLSYDYTGANGQRTGQLTRVINNLDASHNHDRSYTYDALGRLTQARGGPSSAPLWTQSYAYDRYGNRTGVTSSGNTAGTTPPSCSPSQTLATDEFVRNFYQGALGRQPNPVELQTWTDQLRESYYFGQAQELQTAIYMGRQLFKSQEYANRNRSDRDYVYDLYWAYLQRAPDQGGWDFWTGQVAANGRDAVRQAFEGCDEFRIKIASLCPRGSGASAPVPTDGLASLSFDTASNRISSPGFTYDAAGNQTRIVRADGSAQRFQYDAANRLVKVRDDYGYTIASYTYGVDRRILVEQSGNEYSNWRTYFAWVSDSLVAEYSESDSTPTSPQWSKSYIYFSGRLLATVEPGGGGEAVQFHHPDRLGTHLITNADDSGVQEQVTLPFGTALDGESTGASKMRFTSYERSPLTGLDYAMNRYYDSQQGRFTQVDPLWLKASSLSNPQSLNLYAYCGNDPINHVDPSGMFWGKLKRFFKKVLKVLANKWVQLAIAVAIVVISAGTGAPILGFAEAGHHITTATIITRSLTAALSVGLAAGRFSNRLQDQKKEGGDDDEVIRITVSCPRWPVPSDDPVHCPNPGDPTVITMGTDRWPPVPPMWDPNQWWKDAIRNAGKRPPAPAEPPNTVVRTPEGPIQMEPTQGTPRVGARPNLQDEARGIDIPKADPSNPRLPENATTGQRIRHGIARAGQILHDVIQALGGTFNDIIIMVDPEVIRQEACKENPSSSICINGPFGIGRKPGPIT